MKVKEVIWSQRAPHLYGNASAREGGRVMLAWHFLSEDKRLGYDDGRLVEVGQTLECKGYPVLCDNGMHGSVRLIDALRYASGPIVCRVEIEGDVIEGDDKLCGRRRTVLWMLDATQILHEFACACAEDALALVEQPDARIVEVIAAKRKWLDGKITYEELDSAWSAAWIAAQDAAWGERVAASAALAAARAAAEEAAPAARSAALEAAEAAVAVALAAERDAARAVARAVAWDAARDKQNERLTAMVMEAHEKESEP